MDKKLIRVTTGEQTLNEQNRRCFIVNIWRIVYVNNLQLFSFYGICFTKILLK